MKILDVPQSGSTAGTTSSRNRFGQYRRSRSIPTNPSSEGQQRVRSSFAAASQAWADVPEANRASWNYFAQANPVQDALGQQVVLTGAMMFNAVNQRLARANFPTVNLPPSSLVVTVPVIDSVKIAPVSDVWGGASITISPVANGTTVRHLIFSSPPKSAGSGYNGDFRHLVTSQTGDQAVIPIATQLFAKWGAAPYGAKMFFRVYTVASDGGWSPNSGVVSGIVSASAPVVLPVVRHGTFSPPKAKK